MNYLAMASIPRAAFAAERRVTLRAPCMHVGKRRGAHVARREEKHDIKLTKCGRVSFLRPTHLAVFPS